MIEYGRSWGRFLGMIAPLAARVGINYGKSEKFNKREKSDGTVTPDLYRADIITSKMGESKWHKVLLDIDCPAYLTESSTPGHHHLWIDQAVEWEKLVVVLHALADAGIIEMTAINSPAPEINPTDPPPF